jgi:hypothetical protein
MIFSKFVRRVLAWELGLFCEATYRQTIRSAGDGNNPSVIAGGEISGMAPGNCRLSAFLPTIATAFRPVFALRTAATCGGLPS